MLNQISRSVSVLLLLLIAVTSSAQSESEPVREQILNGLTILLWQRPDPKVLLKLRIHSGAAFDLAGKGGTMALLGDSLFPDPTTREYVSDQLGGKLEVRSSYDDIEITISGKSADFERLVELLRTALTSNQLSPENVAKLREAKIKQLESQPQSSAADEAIAGRLFGAFPYGHPVNGTPETVAKIERADLLLARERFLNADNATLAVAGPIERARALRAIRQLLGPWQKGDRSEPATFRQPNPPDKRVLMVDRPGRATAEVRLAVRGFAQSSRDAVAASGLARIVRARWQASVPELSQTFVRAESHALPGAFVLGGTIAAPAAAKAIASAQQVMQALANSEATPAELDRARTALMEEFMARMNDPEDLLDVWLDAELYKLPGPGSQLNAIRSLTASDIQRVAGKLFTDAPLALVVVGDSGNLRDSLGAHPESGNSKPKTDAIRDSLLPVKKP